MPEKRWPAKQFAALARRLQASRGILSGVIGGREDEELCSQLVDLGKGSILSYMPAESLEETAALMEMAACVVCNDSMGLHLAAAVDASVVALFGPTDPHTVAPRGEKIRVVQGSLPPSYRQILGTFDREQSAQAMASISLDSVVAAVEAALE
jgi:ADP-heptose:LPS heptosyltransferase